MSRVTAWMDRRLYPNHSDNWDDELFRQVLLAELPRDARVLDLGAGAGMVAQMNLRGRVRQVSGLDPDPRVLENPYLDEARQGLGDAIPWDDATFDAVFADNVLEHLEDPVAVFREVSRVLVPGGRFYAKTPNRRHYVPRIAEATPTWFHRAYNALRGRAAVDTFPTRYRANTPGDLAELARASGLVLEEARLVEGRPEYLRLTPLTYAAGAAWERVVNRFDALVDYRVLLIARLRKPSP